MKKLQMKLRGKTISIVVITLAFLLLLLYFMSRSVLMSGFSRVEINDTRRNVSRVIDAFDEAVNNLTVKAADWAKWDDTYDFIEDRNQEYVESNLTDASLAELQLNFMLFVNDRKEIVYGRWYDYQEETGKEIDSSLINEILNSAKLFETTGVEDEVTKGIMVVNATPFYIVSRSILTSSGSGPARGRLLFGKVIDDTEVQRISRITHLDLSVTNLWDSTGISTSVTTPSKVIYNDNHTTIFPISDNIIAGLSALEDIYKNKVLSTKIEVPREIYKQGRITLLYIVLSILLVGIIFGIVIVLLLEKTVLSRVAHLNNDVNCIGTNGDHSARVAISGTDEIANLGASINSMLTALEKTERVVRKKNLEMRMIMNTVPSGLLTINKNYSINPEYSKSAEMILGKSDLAGMNFFDAIGLSEDRQDERKKLVDFLEVLEQELLLDKDLAALNPFEELLLFDKGGGVSTWVRLKFYLIVHDDKIQKDILVVVEDITDEKLLAEKVKNSEQENLQLKAIAEDPDLFKDFLSEMRTIIGHADQQLEILSDSGDKRVIVNEIFRDVHTIKGTADAFGLATVTDISGQLENALSPLRTNGAISDDMIAATKKSLNLLSQAVLDVVEGAKKILGEEPGSSDDIHLKISLQKLKMESLAINKLLMQELVKRDHADKLFETIDTRLRCLRCIPAKRGLAKALKIIPSLAMKLEKNIDFVFTGDDIQIDCELAHELNTPLIHLLRNAFDHGIEFPDERVSLGKNDNGTVHLKISENESFLLMQISDDGRGLDPDKLKAVAIERGFLARHDACNLTTEECYALIFKPGFSTSTVVDDISGRGVGMDAVLDTVEHKLNGKISILSAKGSGTTFTMQIPKSNPGCSPFVLGQELAFEKSA